MLDRKLIKQLGNFDMLESKYLKDDVHNIQKLMTIPPLKKFETESLRHLIRLSKIREYEPGETIIKEGGKDQWIYFLLSGKVRVAKQGIPLIVINKKGELFGEMRILDGLARSASVTAIIPTSCLAVNTSATDRLCSEDERSYFLLVLYRVIAEFISIRLRSTTSELIKAKRAITHLPVTALQTS